MHDGVHHGDCLDLLAKLPAGCAQLVYADPPFFTGKRRHALRGGKPAGTGSFEDLWAGDLSAYLGWLAPRLEAAWRVLRPDGSLFVHLDWHAVHYVKVEMDRLFGAGAFRNEIVWHYPGWARDLRGHFSRKHDSILFYARGRRAKFRPVARPWTREEYVARRKQRIHVEEGTGREYIYDGRGAKGARRYLDEALAEGRFQDDVWEVGALTSSSKERAGYATQKPEALLEVVVRSATDPGDLVIDPFCGSGTTLAVALRLGRRAIGFDTSAEAVRIARRRLSLVRREGEG